jgi:hypothetical protein
MRPPVGESSSSSVPWSRMRNQLLMLLSLQTAAVIAQHVPGYSAGFTGVGVYRRCETMPCPTDCLSRRDFSGFNTNGGYCNGLMTYLSYGGSQSACFTSCEGHAQSSGFSKGFCCEYRSFDLRCRVNTNDAVQTSNCLTATECQLAAQALGISYMGAGAYTSKGCYAWSSGTNAGKAWFGTGGTTAQMQAGLDSSKYRFCSYTSTPLWHRNVHSV